MPQLGTRAILQDLDHQGEQLLSQSNVVIHDLDETAITFGHTFVHRTLQLNTTVIIAKGSELLVRCQQ